VNSNQEPGRNEKRYEKKKPFGEDFMGRRVHP